MGKFLNKSQRKAVMAKLKKEGVSPSRREKLVERMERNERGVVFKRSNHLANTGDRNKRSRKIDKRFKAIGPGKRITPNANTYWERRRDRADKRKKL